VTPARSRRGGVRQAGPPQPGVPQPGVPQSLLRAAALTKVFRTDAGPVQAVRGVDLCLAPGEFVAVMGPSGSGKSTLLHLLGGLTPATSGEIWLAGERVDRLSQARWALLRRRRIGFVFQFFNLVSNLSVADNVELPALMSGATRKQARARREELLAGLGLAHRADAAPARLSGGEQQRVALARALAHQPSLLLADEPTGNLDSANAADVLRLLGRTHQQGQAILLVTHNARVAAMADRVVSLFDGMIADDVPLSPAASGPAAGGRAGNGTLSGAASGVLELKG
jgi:putative ABC transport system ATP-binding protein